MNILPQKNETFNPLAPPDHYPYSDTPEPPHWMDDAPSTVETRAGDPSHVVWKVGESMPAQRFTFLSPDELFARPPREMLIDGLLGVGELAMLYSESGAGKTFVVGDLSGSAITGGRFADEFDIPRPLTVCYAAGEGTGGLAERFKAVFSTHGITPAQAGNMTVALEVPQLFAPSGNGMAEFVRDYKVARGDNLDLLIVDTLHSATYGSNENSAQDAGAILKAVKYAQSQLSCAVLLVHHAGKGGNGERGSTAFRGAMDVIMEIVRLGGKSVLKCSKIKDGTPFTDIAFSLVAKEDSARVFWEGRIDASQGKSGKFKQEQIIEWLTDNPGKHTANQIANGLGAKGTSIYELLEKLRRAGDIERHGSKIPYSFAMIQH